MMIAFATKASYNKTQLYKENGKKTIVFVCPLEGFFINFRAKRHFSRCYLNSLIYY